MTLRETAHLMLDPRGRMNRKGLLAVAAPLVVVQLALYALFGLYGFNAHNSGAVLAFEVLFLAVAFTLAAKRLHDCNLTAWWIPGALGCVVALIFASSFGFLMLLGPGSLVEGHVGYVATVGVSIMLMMGALLWLHCKKGTPDTNRFGPPPNAFGVSHPSMADRVDDAAPGVAAPRAA
ncbi:MAG: DUF805 domain-containing protein [Pseudomonadota bacterium]